MLDPNSEVLRECEHDPLTEQSAAPMQPSDAIREGQDAVLAQARDVMEGHPTTAAQAHDVIVGHPTAAAAHDSSRTESSTNKASSNAAAVAHDMEHCNQASQLDYVIFFVSEDEDHARDLHDRFTKLGYDGRLFNDMMPFQDFYIQGGSLEHVRELTVRSTHVLFCISNNIHKSDDADEYVFLKGAVLTQWLDEERRKRRLIPVYLTNKKELTNETKTHLFGITSLSGFHPNSKYFEEDVKKQFNCAASRNLKDERIQEEHKTGARQNNEPPG